MNFWIFLIFLIFFIVGVAFICGTIISKKQEAMDKELEGLSNFSATQKIMGNDGNTGFAIDEKNKKICLIEYTNQNVTTRIFPYKDLLSSEIIENGTTITKVIRSSQISSAVIGGLAFGSVGAVISGLSGKTNTLGRVKRIDLKLTVNDIKKPIHIINFLNLETKKDSFFIRRL